MRKVLFAGFILMFALCLATPAEAAIECQVSIDSRAYNDAESSFCWLSGRICVVCWDLDTLEWCASDWGGCDPNYDPGPWPPMVRLDLDDEVLYALSKNESCSPSEPYPTESDVDVVAELL